MSEYQPTQTDQNNLAEALFWIGTGLDPHLVCMTESAEGAAWVEAQLEAMGHGLEVQFLVTQAE